VRANRIFCSFLPPSLSLSLSQSHQRRSNASDRLLFHLRVSATRARGSAIHSQTYPIDVRGRGVAASRPPRGFSRPPSAPTRAWVQVHAKVEKREIERKGERERERACRALAEQSVREAWKSARSARVRCVYLAYYDITRARRPSSVRLCSRGKTHFCNARAQFPRCILICALRASERARALARLYSLPANLRRAANERFTFNVISVRGA